MPSPKGPQLKEKILALAAKGGMTWTEIAKEVGCSHGTVSWHLRKKEKDYKPNTQHHLDGKDVRAIKNLSLRGLSTKEISKQLGVSLYHIYKLRNSNGITDREHASVRKFDMKVFQLKENGLSLTQIANKLHKPHGTVSSAYYRHIKNQHKGETNGHVATNGHAAERGSSANRNILIGIAFAETQRFITNLSERTKIPSEILERRLSELLGHSPLRE